MSRLCEIARKTERLLAGISSGTSADGVDAALVKVSGRGPRLRAEVLAHQIYPYPDTTKAAVRLASDGEATTAEICRLNYHLGEVFSRACVSLLASAGLGLKELDAVGSHGQTVWHIPGVPGKDTTVLCSTLQLGEASIIAQKTGAVVVYDFRAADIAAGGEGAPLAPCVDYLLFRNAAVSRGLLNIGGIANLAILPPDCSPEQVIGFDTGPGNMVLDQLARDFFKKEQDTDGVVSSRGRPSMEIVDDLHRLAFFRKPPPKSAGRETFGRPFSDRLLSLGEEKGLSREDIMATAAALTAYSVHRSYLSFVPESATIDELYVSGGGVYNKTIMTHLKSLFSPIPVHPVDKLGVPARAKEALLFAVLANQAILGEPASLPQVTGAAERKILGKIVL